MYWNDAILRGCLYIYIFFFNYITRKNDMFFCCFVFLHIQPVEVEVLRIWWQSWKLKFLEKFWVSCRFPAHLPMENWMKEYLPSACSTLSVPCSCCPSETSWDDPCLHLPCAQSHLNNCIVKAEKQKLLGHSHRYFSCLLEVKMNYTLKAAIYFYWL